MRPRIDTSPTVVILNVQGDTIHQVVRKLSTLEANGELFHWLSNAVIHNLYIGTYPLSRADEKGFVVADVVTVLCQWVEQTIQMSFSICGSLSRQRILLSAFRSDTLPTITCFSASIVGIGLKHAIYL